MGVVGYSTVLFFFMHLDTIISAFYVSWPFVFRSCAQSSSLAQLILPESLKLLPLYSLGLLKTTLLRKGTDIKVDDRAFLIAAFNSMPIITVIRYMYPMLVPLHNCDQVENCGHILEDKVS